MQQKLLNVGQEVAVLESPTARLKPPARQARIVALRPKNASRWEGPVQVQFLTDPNAWTGYGYGLDARQKDLIVWISARQVVGVWNSSYAEAFAAAEANTQGRKTAIKNIEARLDNLRISGIVSAYSMHPWVTSLSVSGSELERLLCLAERSVGM